MLGFNVTIVQHKTVASGVQFWRTGLCYKCISSLRRLLFWNYFTKAKLSLEVYLMLCLLHFQVFSFPQEKTHCLGKAELIQAHLLSSTLLTEQEICQSFGSSDFNTKIDTVKNYSGYLTKILKFTEA